MTRNAFRERVSWETKQQSETMIGGAGCAIAVDGMTARRGNVPVIRDVSLRIPRGSIVALVGAAGSGKTTVLRALATLQPVKATVMWLGGIDAMAHPNAVRALIGYMPQEDGCDPDLTVTEELQFHGAAQGLNRRQRRQTAADLLELADLTPCWNTPIADLSSDARRRLSFIRCLLHDPEVLLLDQPLRNLGEASRRELGAILSDLSSIGKTVLLTTSTESAPEMATFCTQAILIDGGTVLADGPMEAILGRLAPNGRGADA
jgi:ABC-2 type transport system ATP-binding protein